MPRNSRSFCHLELALNRFTAGLVDALATHFTKPDITMTNTDKEGYSQNFFSKNREALHDVIDEACDFIENAREAASEQTQTQTA